MQTSKQKLNSSFEYLQLFYSFFMILLLVLILIYSVRFWVANFPYLNTIDAQYFYAGVGIAVVTTVGEWISGRLKAVNKNWDNLKMIRRKHGRQKRRN